MDSIFQTIFMMSGRLIGIRRCTYLAARSPEGMIVFECDAASFWVYGPLATQTSQLVRREVARFRSVSQFRPRMTSRVFLAYLRSTQEKSNGLGVAFHMPCDVDPHVMDCIVNFWTESTLSVPPQKTLSYPSRELTKPEGDPTRSKANAACGLTSLQLMTGIYEIATYFEDEHLKKAALHRMRLHVECTNPDIHDMLIMIAWLYGQERKIYYPIRRIVLSGLVLQAVEVQFGRHKDMFVLAGRESIAFILDFCLATTYFYATHPGIILKSEEEEDAELFGASGQGENMEYEYEKKEDR